MYKRLILLFQFPFLFYAQLSGTLTVPGSYVTIDAAISDLNQQGVGGALTILVAATHTEVVPSGGYSLYASGSVQNTILFKSSSLFQRPLLIAPSNGNKSAGSSSQDGIWRLIGCDYVTIDGFQLRDTNSTAPQSMEFGFGLFKASGSNGCQFVTIRNCGIQLNQTNNASGNLPACDGSRGIEMVNAQSGSHTSSLAIISPAGAHSNNKFYSNVIEQCNYGISLMGYNDSAPYLNADFNNSIGGNSAAFTNTIINFGGGGTNPSAAIRSQSQYSLVVSSNLIQSSTSSNYFHTGTLRGIYTNQAPEAFCEINSNTVTVKSASANSQLVAIENQSGSNGTNNLVSIQNNVIENCSHGSSIAGSYYGIYNSASSASLTITGNRFVNNSSSALNGSNFLIYSNASVSNHIGVSLNTLQFIFEGSAAFSGNFSCINVAGAAATCSVNILGNSFQNIIHRPYSSSSTIYFISNTSDVSVLTINNNLWEDLHLNHSGNQYCIYNASSTSSLLSVVSNTISNYHRMLAGNFYFYYANSNSPGTAVHTLSANIINDLQTEAGLGNFYGIFDAEGNQSPYPRKIVAGNRIQNIRYPTSGAVYGIYLSDLGDAGTSLGSVVFNNEIKNLQGNDNIYGLYLNSSYSPNSPTSAYDNTISSISSNGANGSVYGAYLASNNAGPVFFRNRLHDLNTAATSGSVCAVYAASSGTYVIHHNLIAQLTASNAAGINRINGIYLNTGTLVKLFYNTVRIDAVSSGANFGSNALYSSSTPSLELRNNILINLSIPTGTAFSCAYRRSSTASTTYSLNSNNNVFFAGTPSSNRLLFYNGSASYSTLTQFQIAFNPRESASFDQTVAFQSLNGSHPSFLHPIAYLTTNVESGAATIPTFSNDVDSEIRQGFAGYTGTGTAPDIGADEFQLNSNPCTTAASSTISALTKSICATNSALFFALSPSSGTGISYQWKSSNSASGPFTNVNSGLGANSIEYSVSLNSSGVYYFQIETTCLSNSQTAQSNVITLTVFPNPSVTINSNSMLCAGASLSLSASGSNTKYLWKGPAAFTSVMQNPILTNVPAYATGVYSLNASLGPCVSQTQTISVNVFEVTAFVSAQPPIICSGSASTLTAVGNATSYVWNNTLSGSSATVFPSQSSIYTLQAIGSGNCSNSYTVQLAVISPTVQPINGLACLPVTTATCGIQSFPSAYMSWFTPSQTLIPFSFGSTLSVNSNTPSNFLTKASLLHSVSITGPISGTTSVSSIMFDVLPLNNFLLQGIDLHLSSTAISTLAIWTRAGSFSNYTTTSNGWILLGSGTLQATGAASLSNNTLSFNLPLYNSQTQAFCISVSGSSLETSAAFTPSIVWTNAPFIISSGLTGNLFNVSGNNKFFEGGFRIANEICSSALTPVTVNLSNAPALIINASSFSLCPGQTATITASGANSYTWMNASVGNSISVIVNTPQTINVTGANQFGCVASASVLLVTHSLSPINIQISAVSVCPNSKTSFTATGANTYTWSNGPNGPNMSVFPYSNSTYTVFGTNSLGCVSQKTVSVQTRTLPLVQISAPNTLICKGSFVPLFASGAMSYTWLPSGQLADSIVVQPFVNSVYNVIGTGVNTCTNVAFINLVLDECVSLNTLSLNAFYFEVEIGFEQIVLHSKCNFEYLVMDPQGKILYSSDEKKALHVLIKSSYSRGMYLVQARFDGRYACKKIVID